MDANSHKPHCILLDSYNRNRRSRPFLDPLRGRMLLFWMRRAAFRAVSARRFHLVLGPASPEGWVLRNGMSANPVRSERKQPQSVISV